MSSPAGGSAGGGVLGPGAYDELQNIEPDEGRWRVVGTFAALILMTDFMGFSLAPLQEEAVDYFGDSISVDFLFFTYSAGLVVGCLVAPGVIHSLGIRFSTIGAAFLLLFSALLRGGLPGASNQSVSCLYAASFLTGCVAPLFQIPVGYVVEVWMPFKERFVSTSLLVVADEIGVVFAYSLAEVYLRDAAANLESYLHVQTLLVLVILVLAVVFVRDKPRLPPSKSAAMKRARDREAEVESEGGPRGGWLSMGLDPLRRSAGIFLFPPFWSILLCFLAACTTSNIVGDFLPDFMESIGIGETSSGLLGAAFHLVFAVTAIFAGWVQDRKRDRGLGALSLLVIAASAAMTISSIVFLSGDREEIGPWLTMITIAAVMGPIKPISANTAVEITWGGIEGLHVDESDTFSVLVFLENLFTTLVIAILGGAGAAPLSFLYFMTVVTILATASYFSMATSFTFARHRIDHDPEPSLLDQEDGRGDNFIEI